MQYEKIHDMEPINKKDGLLLALLGRGIQQTSLKNMTWELTHDLEVCDEKGAHLPVRAPENDDDPRSIIGGGELNALAGTVLSQTLHPDLVVCAYGARSKYLNSIGAPSESHVMSDRLTAEITKAGGTVPEIEVFDEEQWRSDATGTNQELHNIFTLAVRRGITNIAITSVAVHIPRVLLMANHHLKNDPVFKGLAMQCYASELVLLESGPEHYRDRVDRIFGSQSYVRNFARELSGMNDFLAGKYKNIASTIA